jgi:hypothetical protein
VQFVKMAWAVAQISGGLSAFGLQHRLQQIRLARGTKVVHLQRFCDFKLQRIAVQTDHALDHFSIKPINRIKGSLSAGEFRPGSRCDAGLADKFIDQQFGHAFSIQS